jgi:hypothetical protein
MIKPPNWRWKYPDRDMDCPQAIEWAFQEFLENVMPADLASGFGKSVEITQANEHLATPPNQRERKRSAMRHS